MSHWSDKYIGRPYIAGVADCMHLAEEIALDVLKINPKLPQSHETSLRKQAEQIDRLKADYAIKVCEPIDGHPVLFIARGRFYHCGVAAIINGNPWILHNDQSAGMVLRQRIRDITLLHFKLEGFYKWIAS